MKMKLEEIQKRHNISSNDLEEIKSQLKTKIKESHPDNNNEYGSDYITELNNDLDYVENLIKNSGTPNTLVPMNEVLQTLAEILQVPGKKDPKDVLNEKLSTNIQSRLLITKKRLRTPRIGSATVVAIITFIWLFPNQIMEHPLIQMVLGDSRFATIKFALVITVVWLLALLYAIMIWIRSLRTERMEKAIMERVKLENVQNEIFMNFLSSISPNKIFSKRDFMTYLAHGLSEEQRQRKTLYYFKPEEEIVQNMADIILLRAKEYEIIKTSKSCGLIECYEIIQDEFA